MPCRHSARPLLDPEPRSWRGPGPRVDAVCVATSRRRRTSLLTPDEILRTALGLAALVAAASCFDPERQVARFEPPATSVSRARRRCGRSHISSVIRQPRRSRDLETPRREHVEPDVRPCSRTRASTFRTPWTPCSPSSRRRSTSRFSSRWREQAAPAVPPGGDDPHRRHGGRRVSADAESLTSLGPRAAGKIGSGSPSISATCLFETSRSVRSGYPNIDRRLRSRFSAPSA